MRPPRATVLVLAGLAPLGTVAGHAAGYALAGHPAGLDGAHRHLGPAAWVGALAAAAVLAWAAAGRDAGTAWRSRVGALALGQVGLFLALETAEHVAGGHGLAGLATDPASRWGLAAQVVAATALVVAVSLARVGGDQVRALLAPAGHPPADGRVPLTRLPDRPAPRSRPWSPASERGPPLLLGPAPA